MIILTIILGAVGALLLAYIGVKLLQMRVKSVSLVYFFFVGLYIILLAFGTWIPIAIYIAGELFVIWIIVRFMGF